MKKKTKIMLYNILNFKSKKNLKLKVYNEMIDQVNNVSWPPVY